MLLLLLLVPLLLVLPPDHRTVPSSATLPLGGRSAECKGVGAWALLFIKKGLQEQPILQGRREEEICRATSTQY